MEPRQQTQGHPVSGTRGNTEHKEWVPRKSQRAGHSAGLGTGDDEEATKATTGNEAGVGETPGYETGPAETSGDETGGEQGAAGAPGGELQVPSRMADETQWTEHPRAES